MMVQVWPALSAAPRRRSTTPPATRPRRPLSTPPCTSVAVAATLAQLGLAEFVKHNAACFAGADSPGLHPGPGERSGSLRPSISHSYSMHPTVPRSGTVDISRSERFLDHFGSWLHFACPAPADSASARAAVPSDGPSGGACAPTAIATHPLASLALAPPRVADPPHHAYPMHRTLTWGQGCSYHP